MNFKKTKFLLLLKVINRQAYCVLQEAHTNKKRVALVITGFVVVIRLTGANRARFVTAYVPGRQASGTQKDSTYNQIRKSPKWK